MKYVLIGAGPAGVRAAETLRKEDPSGEITLVGGEPGEPYARMAIPYVLNRSIDESGALQRKTELHYDHQRIRYLNRKALKVNAGPEGGTVDLDDGSTLEYDRLLVATGSSPSLPPIPGTDLPGVVTCWTLQDARAIAEKLQPGNRVVMYSLTTCGYCAEKRERMTTAGIPFREYFVDTDPARMDEFNALLDANGLPAGAVGTPTLTVNGKLLVNNPDMATIKKHLKFKT